MQKDKIKTDLSALFTPRQPSMTNEEAVSIVDQVDPINLSHSIVSRFFFVESSIATVR